MQHALDIDGNDVSLGDFAGKVLLILNVASACGYTEQNYKGLQALYEKYGSYGFEILAFPSNQFGGQEPGTEKHIKEFVTSRYGVTFRMMSKVDVNGPDAHPVFKCAFHACRQQIACIIRSPPP
jgi:glutathione peroxidase